MAQRTLDCHITGSHEPCIAGSNYNCIVDMPGRCGYLLRRLYHASAMKIAVSDSSCSSPRIPVLCFLVCCIHFEDLAVIVRQFVERERIGV